MKLSYKYGDNRAKLTEVIFFRLFGFYITNYDFKTEMENNFKRTCDYEKVLREKISQLENQLKELRSAEYYYDDKLQRWRDKETGQIVAAKVAMTAQLKAERAEREASGSTQCIGH